MVEAGKIVVALGNPFDIGANQAALRAKFFNVIVIDEFSAGRLLKEA